MNAKATTATEEKPVESPENETPVVSPTDGAENESTAVVEAPKPIEGTHLPAIRENMSPTKVKIPEMGPDGRPTGKMTTLATLFSRWHKHHETGKSLGYTLGALAVEVAMSNRDISVESQHKIFAGLCLKAEEQAFPIIVAKDETGDIVYNAKGEPMGDREIPNSYHTVMSQIKSYWLGEGQITVGKKKVKLPSPIIPGKEYEVFDGRSKEFKPRLVQTVGDMKAAGRALIMRKQEKAEEAAIKVGKNRQKELADIAEKRGFVDDEVKGAIAAGTALIKKEGVSAAEVQKANKVLNDLVTKRQAQDDEKRGIDNSAEAASGSDKKAAETVELSTDAVTGETIPVDTETGLTAIDSLGLDRHLAAEEGYAVRFLATVLSATTGSQREKLLGAIRSLTLAALEENKDLKARVRTAVQQRTKERNAA